MDPTHRSAHRSNEEPEAARLGWSYSQTTWPTIELIYCTSPTRPPALSHGVGLPPAPHTPQSMVLFVQEVSNCDKPVWLLLMKCIEYVVNQCRATERSRGEESRSIHHIGGWASEDTKWSERRQHESDVDGRGVIMRTFVGEWIRSAQSIIFPYSFPPDLSNNGCVQSKSYHDWVQSLYMVLHTIRSSTCNSAKYRTFFVTPPYSIDNRI